MKTLVEQILLDRHEYTQEFKDQIAFEVLYEGAEPKELQELYALSNIQAVHLWVNNYRKRLEEGIVALPLMTEEQKENVKALQKRVKELEKALEKANTLVYGLNTMIDYAEKELKVPIRKKRGTKQ